MEPSSNNNSKQDGKLRFLVATDIHLGHAQNHQQLGNDSYLAFQEVLSIAKKQDVDFLLLGGDLFDQVNPSQKSIFKCLNLLKDNIFGDRQLRIGVHGLIPNFSNQNLNISLPIFTIHGNHDYPSNDFGKISVCDLLHASNYVNYFGKHINLVEQGEKKIIVRPIIFQKVNLKTRLAIYGLGYIKDLKLFKMFKQKSIIFQQPQKKQQTICIFILHQNRHKGKKGGVGASYENCIHPQFLPKWIDLVIWCHQHEAIYKIQKQSDISIFQPGSTVITSFIEAEGFKKQCGLITVGPNMKLDIKSIPLQESFRPMITKSYSLQQILQKQENKQKFNFDQYFDKQLLNLLEQFGLLGIDRKPIIRIKIDYTGHQIIRLIRVQQKYRQLVANSNKIFTYTQKKLPKKAFNLQDNQVLDIIKNSRVPKNILRQTQLTQQIMQIFTQQLSKSKLHFFDIPNIKDKIIQLSNNQGRANMNELKMMYARQLQSKCMDSKKQISNFQQTSERQFQRIKQKLLKNSSLKLQGKESQINLQDIKADICRLKSSYQEEQKYVQSIFSQVHEKNQQNYSKSTVKTSSNRGNSISSQQKGLQSDREKSNRHSNSSDQEPCCQKRLNEQYRENDTRNKFLNAHKMVQNEKKQAKGKKNVKFKEI